MPATRVSLGTGCGAAGDDKSVGLPLPELLQHCYAGIELVSPPLQVPLMLCPIFNLSS